MHQVSNEYKEAVYAPIRTAKGKVTFDISDVTAAGDVNNITVTTQHILSNKQQLINKNREQSYNLATWEPNRFKLDGSFTFADDTIANNKELGFCSNVLCGADGVFSEFPTIVFTFNSNHSSMGLTITFDASNEEYASDFTVNVYDSSNDLIETVDVFDNTDIQSIPLGQLYQYRKVELIIKKWCKPYRRARVCEVDFGVVRIYQDNNLIRMSLIEELDLITSQLPSPEFAFTVDNSKREFNILNPQGFYKYLQQRQQVIAELGIDLGGYYEYVPLGNYLLWDWTSDEGSLTASFTARTLLDVMSSFDYENLITKSDYTLYEMAVDIFAICGITTYQIDTALQDISTLGLVEKANCKDILQMIAIAGCANVYVTRNSIITIKVSPLSIGAAVDTIDLDNMYNEPQIALDGAVKGSAVTYYTNLSTKHEVTVNNVGVEVGDLLRLEGNTLINTSAKATEVANWIIREKTYRAIYTTNWRGNPAHELNDIVTIEDGYEQNKNAFITKNELNYEGYISGKTEARGLTDVVD